MSDIDRTLALQEADLSYQGPLLYKKPTNRLPILVHEHDGLFGVNSGRSYNILPRFGFREGGRQVGFDGIPNLELTQHETYGRYRHNGQEEFTDFNLDGDLPSVTPDQIREVHARLERLGVPVRIGADFNHGVFIEEGMDWPYEGREDIISLPFQELLERLPKPTVKVYFGIDKNADPKWTDLQKGGRLSKALTGLFYQEMNQLIATGKYQERPETPRFMAAGRVPELLAGGIGKGRLIGKSLDLLSVSKFAYMGDEDTDLVPMAMAEVAFIISHPTGVGISPRAIEILEKPDLLKEETDPNILRMFRGMRDFEPTKIAILGPPDDHELALALTQSAVLRERKGRRYPTSEPPFAKSSRRQTPPGSVGGSRRFN